MYVDDPLVVHLRIANLGDYMFRVIKQFFSDINSGNLYKKSLNVKITLSARTEQALYIILFAIF